MNEKFGKDKRNDKQEEKYRLRVNKEKTKI